MKTLFNCDEIAFSRGENYHQHHFEYDLVKSFFTPYGMFLPLYSSGYLLLRALRGEIKGSDLVKTNIVSRFIHVNSHGQVWYVGANSPEDDISHTPVVTKHWTMTGFRGNDTGNSIAYGHLLKACPTLEKAVKRIDRVAYDGFFEPQCFSVKDIAKQLIDLGYTEEFFFTRFSDF